MNFIVRFYSNSLQRMWLQSSRLASGPISMRQNHRLNNNKHQVCWQNILEFHIADCGSPFSPFWYLYCVSFHNSCSISFLPLSYLKLKSNMQKKLCFPRECVMSFIVQNRILGGGLEALAQ